MMTDFSINKVEDVLWSLTETCNLKCIYCSVEAGQNTLIKEPSKAEIDHILKQIKKLPELRSLILSGGEALLSNYFPYVVEEASSLCSNIYVITNGVNLPSKAIDALRFHRPTVMVSIDSTIENINNQTRGVGILEKTLSTLKILQAMGLPIVVISVVTRFNINSIKETLTSFYNLGIKNVLLQQLHCEGRAGRDLYMQLSPHPEQIDVLYNILLEIEESYPDINIDYNEICFFPMRKAIYTKKCDSVLNYKHQKLFMCGAGFSFFAIKTNGDVIPCNALRSCVFGNLLQEDIIDILGLSEEAINIRRLRLLRVDSVTECKDCIYSPICDGGCRADVLHLTGNILLKHPYCNIQRKTITQF